MLRASTIMIEGGYGKTSSPLVKIEKQVPVGVQLNVVTAPIPTAKAMRRLKTRMHAPLHVFGADGLEVSIAEKIAMPIGKKLFVSVSKDSQPGQVGTECGRMPKENGKGYFCNISVPARTKVVNLTVIVIPQKEVGPYYFRQKSMYMQKMIK